MYAIRSYYVLGGTILSDGLFGIAALRPTDLLGTGIGDSVGNAVFWSLGLNLIRNNFV